MFRNKQIGCFRRMPSIQKCLVILCLINGSYKEAMKKTDTLFVSNCIYWVWIKTNGQILPLTHTYNKNINTIITIIIVTNSFNKVYLCKSTVDCILYYIVQDCKRNIMERPVCAIVRYEFWYSMLVVLISLYQAENAWSNDIKTTSIPYQLYNIEYVSAVKSNVVAVLLQTSPFSIVQLYNCGEFRYVWESLHPKKARNGSIILLAQSYHKFFCTSLFVY